jgi:chorismate mutase-like protein
MAAEGKDSLNNFRKEIDSIDDKLLELLAERSRVVQMVGKFKHAAGEKNSIIRPGREAAMIRRISNKGGGAFSKAAIAHLWRLIIASSITIEEDTRISALSPQQNTECYWLAREYFGAFTPIEKHASTSDVMRDVVERKSTVGVIPIWDENSPKPWWLRLTETEEPPFVFAKLPFIKNAPSQRSPLVAMGYIAPEPTGDDQSLWVLKLAEQISFEDIEDLAKKTFGDDMKVVDQCRQVANPTMHCYLIQAHDFIAKDDKRVDKFLETAKATINKDLPVETYYLGSFASPISIES